jgi:hypothetical protein
MNSEVGMGKGELTEFGRRNGEVGKKGIRKWECGSRKKGMIGSGKGLKCEVGMRKVEGKR